MEWPTDSQGLTMGESSHAGEERAGSSGVAKQHATEQHDEGTVPATEEPSAASGGVMGFILVGESGAKNPAMEAPTPEATAVEELEVEETVHQAEEPVAP